MTDDLRFFEELGVELERVARAQPESRWYRARRWLHGPTGFLACGFAALVLAGAATAGILLIREGRPIPAPPAQELGANSEPVPGSVQLAGLNVPDPAGGPAWDIRLSRSRTGETCTAVGQIVTHQFGIVGLDGVFRRLGLGGVDACANPETTGGVLAGARVFIGRTAAGARTVVNGIAGPNARSVTVYGDAAPRILKLGPDGSFLTVYRGYNEGVQTRVEITDRTGKTRTIALARSYNVQVPDPDGSSVWTLDGGANVDGHGSVFEECMQVHHLSAPILPGQATTQTHPFESIIGDITPQYCGLLSTHAWFAVIQRFNPIDHPNGTWTWFTDQPSRTIAYGSVSPQVQSVTATIAGGAPQNLPIDRGDGGFALVLDGHTDPDEVELTAHLRDGRSLTSTGTATNVLSASTGKAIHSFDVPAYRPVSKAAGNQYASQPFEIPIRSSVRTTLTAKDPAHGPTWVLRSWEATPIASAFRSGSPNPDSPHPAMPTHFVCEEAGIHWHGRLVEPALNGQPTVLTFGGDAAGQGGCSDPPTKPTLTAYAYVNNTDLYAPQPSRTVVFGLVPQGSTGATLLGAGRPRRLQIDPNGAVFTLLPGRYWATALQLRATLASGRTSTTTLFQPFKPVKPIAIAPDPDGGPPWGFTVGPNNFQQSGEFVDGILAYVSAQGRLMTGGQSSGGGTAAPGHSPLKILTPQSVSPDTNADGTLSEPQIQRRTLPDRTVIEGTAGADVKSITLRTPRDVRTLIPSGPQHAFIAVYDGYFYDSVVTATALLSNGRTVTETVPGATYPQGVQLNSRPSLRQHLADAIKARYVALHPSKPNPVTLPSGTPLPPTLKTKGSSSGIQLGWARKQLRIIDQIRARLAYTKAHPDALPPN